MVELRRFQVFLLLFLVLEVAAEMTHSLTSLVRDGAEVTLPCENVLSDNCDSTTWSFSQSPTRAAVDLVRGGQISKRTDKSDRLRITSNCSLVITNGTKEEAARYFCIQEKMGQQQDGVAVVDVAVVSMTEEKNDGVVLLKCRLWTRGMCEHTVEWLFEGRHVDKDLNQNKLRCLATLTFDATHLIYTSQKYKLLKCNLKEKNSGRSRQFTFQPPSSGRNKTVLGNIHTTNPEELWWLFVIVPVGVTALLITAAVLIRRKKNKAGEITRMEENMPDPEDVSYVSISHTKKTERTAQVTHDDTVIYSAVKTSSAADHSALYASVN